jgi:hypothetical protein
MSELAIAFLGIMALFFSFIHYKLERKKRSLRTE